MWFVRAITKTKKSSIREIECLVITHAVYIIYIVDNTQIQLMLYDINKVFATNVITIVFAIPLLLNLKNKPHAPAIIGAF